jgi:hypothetical protein
MIDLKKLILEKKTVSIDFPGMEGFSLDLCYLGPEALKKLRDKCLVTKIDKKTRAAVSELDDEKFSKEFAIAIIKGWEGFKAKHLAELMLVDISSLDPEELIEFSEENAYTLFKGSDNFARWINEVVFDLANFR